ncbi:hypothetical protein ACK1X7_47415 [Streptomyces sp. CY1]|uniref:hypothetical protein n=1 Tax=unclassified Streptomyces TaxID=2593676 RepID=UPI00369B6378
MTGMASYLNSGLLSAISVSLAIWRDSAASPQVPTCRPRWAVVFVRYADTPWRDRLFLVAGVVQMVAFAIPSLTGGTSLAGMVAYFILYQLWSTARGCCCGRSPPVRRSPWWSASTSSVSWSPRPRQSQARALRPR